MKTLYHSEPIWQGRRIVIDAADLTAECGYIEVMAMYPDGTDIECFITNDLEQARIVYDHYCDLAADRPTAETYTRADWERDGTFKANPGQLITADVYNDMLNCMPPYKLPHALRSDGHTKGFLMGEPSSSDAKGLLYMAFIRHGLRYYYYGLVHLNERSV